MKKNMLFQTKQLVFSLRGTLLFIFLACSNFLVVGQSQSLETEDGMNNAIAAYSSDVRQAALSASQYPQNLTQLQDRQNQTSSSFQNMINGFRQTKQGWFYTLTRYPNLIHTLAALPNGKGKNDIYTLLPNQDEDLKEAAWKLYNNEKQDLTQIDNMEISAQQDFEKSIQQLDKPSQDAFQKLAAMPDVLTLLTNNIGLTSTLGQKYKNNPTQVITDLTTLHDSLTLKNQTEMASFRKQLTENPQAQQEFNQAVKDYGNANGYNNTNQNGNNWNNQNYYNNPYSYWFGYPSWYGSPMWYPGAYGYNSGFGLGFGFGGGYFGYGLPYYGFSNWFINSGYYNRYPALYRQCGSYFNHINYGNNRGMGSYNNGMNNRMGNNGGFRANRGGQVYRNNGGNNRVNNGNPQANRGGQVYRNNGGNNNSVGVNSRISSNNMGVNRGGGNIGGGFHGGSFGANRGGGNRGGGFQGGGFGANRGGGFQGGSFGGNRGGGGNSGGGFHGGGGGGGRGPR